MPFSGGTPFSREIFVHPVMQAGQRRVDHSKGVLEVSVVAIVGIVDIESVGAGPGVEGPQHAQPARLHPPVGEYPEMVAAQCDHEIGAQMVIADRCGTVVVGVSVCAQDARGTFVGAGAGMPVAGARTAHPHHLGQPTRGDLMGEHLLGDRQILPEHTNVTCTRWLDTEHRPQLRHRGDVGRRYDGQGRVEVRLPVPPTHHHGRDAVFGGPLNVVGTVADHQHPFG